MALSVKRLDGKPVELEALPKPARQSATILSALKAMAPQIVLIVATLTGKTLDVDVINHLIDGGYSVVASCITIFYCYRAIQGRKNATVTIKK